MIRTNLNTQNIKQRIKQKKIRKIPLYIGLIRMATAAIRFRSTHYGTVYTEKKQEVTAEQHARRSLLDPYWER